MFLKFHPEGAAEATVYEFRPDRTDFNRARLAEKYYTKLVGERRSWEQFVADATTGGFITARKVALWLVTTDLHPMTRFEDVPDFTPGELTIEYSRHELRQLREGITTSADMVEAEKSAMLSALDRQLETALAGSDEPDPEPEPEPATPGKGEETDEALSS